MKIVVCVKYCPDAQADRRFTTDHTTDRSVDGVLSELDEYAVEQALVISEFGEDTQVIALTIGPDDAELAVRKALQMGVDSGVHISDDAIRGSDALATSLLLAKAVEKMGGADLVLTGMSSTDASMGVVPTMLAARLALPAVTLASEVSVGSSSVTITRDNDANIQTITASLPAVVSVTDHTGEARYPSFKGIMAAKKKPVENWTLADLEVDPSQVGLDAAWTKVTDVTARPPRQAGEIVADEGDGGVKLAEFLKSRKFA